MNIPCPCQSNLTYENCCQPFHQGQLPPTALQLMRSRFSAYALALTDYIMRTTHPSNPQYSTDRESWAKGISEFSRHTQFKNLEILKSYEEGVKATVVFVAYLEQNGKNQTFTERSDFLKIGDRWLYLNGVIADGRAPRLAK